MRVVIAARPNRDDLAMIADAANAVSTLLSMALRRLAQSRESNDTPREKAFCRVAPSVRLSDFAILAAGVL
jgi:hypothetical protein